MCIAMREEFFTDVAEYVDRLEPFMQQMAEQGAWTREERTVVLKYTSDKTGVMFVYCVKQSGAPTVTSTQFTE